MSINYKAQLNGLRKTNWSNKTDDKKLKIIEDKYEKIGRKVPKYLTNGKLTEKKLNRAVTSLVNMYSRKIQSIENKKSSPIDRAYKEYVKSQKNKKSLLQKELKNYPKEIQEAYFDKSKTLGFFNTDINKQEVDILPLKTIKQYAKAIGKTPVSILKDLTKRTIATKDTFIGQAEELIDQILSQHGYSLNEKDRISLVDSLRDVGYLEFTGLLETWQKKLEQGYYEMYKEDDKLDDPNTLYHQFRSEVNRYINNAHRIRVI